MMALSHSSGNHSNTGAAAVADRQSDPRRAVPSRARGPGSRQAGPPGAEPRLRAAAGRCGAPGITRSAWRQLGPARLGLLGPTLPWRLWQVVSEARRPASTALPDGPRYQAALMNESTGCEAGGRACEAARAVAVHEPSPGPVRGFAVDGRPGGQANRLAAAGPVVACRARCRTARVPRRPARPRRLKGAKGKVRPEAAIVGHSLTRGTDANHFRAKLRWG